MKEIRSLAGSFFETDSEEIKDAIRRILALSEAAEKDGVLAMESFICHCEEENFLGKAFLKMGTDYVCEGMMPERIDRLLTNKILAETDKKKQFLCLLYMTGLETIQKENNFYLLKEELCSLFPESCEDAVKAYILKERKEYDRVEYSKKQKLLPEQFYQVSVTLPAEVETRLRTLENAVLIKSRDEIQVILRETDNFDVSSLLLAGTEFFREKIMTNMSARLCIQIMGDVISRGAGFDCLEEEEVGNIISAIDKVGRLL